LILIARTESLLKQTQKEIESLTGKTPLIIPCDISNEEDVDRMAEMINKKCKHVDVLINNAGIGIHKVSEKMSNEEMRRQFGVNFFGPFYCIKALLPLLKLSDSPYILNIGSLVGEMSFADNSIYAATKSALAGFSGGLRRELKEFNIKVGLLLPGLMDTSFQYDRAHGIKAPAFMTLDPRQAAMKLENMIVRNKRETYMYRWMLALMKLKQLF
jgi:short-subunit dehydrogenase